MRLNYRTIGIITIFLYILGIFFLGVNLTNEKQVDILLKNFPEVVFVVVVVLALGLLSFIFLMFANSSKVDVIYVDATESNSKDKTSNTNNSFEKFESLTSSTDLIVYIESLISQNQFNKKNFLDNLLKYLCNQTQASVGAIYILKFQEELRVLEMMASYALYNPTDKITNYKIGEGLVGQVAKNAKPIKLTSIPEGYVEIISGLGRATPSVLMLLPIKNTENEVLGVIEVAAFKDFNNEEQAFLEEVALLLAKEIETNEYQNLNV